MFALDAVPAPSQRRLAVRVTNDAIRQIRGGHPWVFDGSIVSVNHDDATAGDLAVIFDADRQFVAIGLYDPASVIRIRILHKVFVVVSSSISPFLIVSLPVWTAFSANC